MNFLWSNDVIQMNRFSRRKKEKNKAWLIFSTNWIMICFSVIVHVWNNEETCCSGHCVIKFQTNMFIQNNEFFSLLHPSSSHVFYLLLVCSSKLNIFVWFVQYMIHSTEWLSMSGQSVWIFLLNHSIVWFHCKIRYVFLLT